MFDEKEDMNIFNRIWMILALLFIVFVTVVAMVNEFIGFFQWSDLMLRIFNPDIRIPLYISIPALLFVLVVCVFLLMLEFYKVKKRTAVVSSIKGGKAMITLDSIANQITDHLVEIQSISEVKVHAVPRSNGIIIQVMTNICDCEDVPEKMREVIKMANDVARDKLGLKVIKTNVTVTKLTRSAKTKKEAEQDSLLIAQEDQEE